MKTLSQIQKENSSEKDTSRLAAEKRRSEVLKNQAKNYSTYGSKLKRKKNHDSSK